MLQSLYIENFTIIDKLEVSFEEGMNVLSGETGAGKSIIIDAIGQLAGNRTNTDFIKSDAHDSFIEGVFFVDNKNTLEKLKENDIELEDNTLVISKRISDNGKTVIKINYRPATISLLKNVMSEIIDIHNQFDMQLLFNEANHLDYLDNYIGDKILTLKDNYLNEYNEYVSLKHRYSSLKEEEMSDEQFEFYQTQLEEINNFDFDDFDEDRLIAERNDIKNAKKTVDSFEAYNRLIGPTLERFKEAISYLDQIESENFKELDEKINDIYYEVEDINSLVNDYYHSLSFSKEREEEIFDILTFFNSLKRKYGNSINQILDFKKDLEDKIDAFSNRDKLLSEMNKKIEDASKSIIKKADEIHQLRVKGIKDFEKAIVQDLKSLYLENVTFKISIKEIEPNKNGIDDIKFLISTNLGEELKPLKDVASGGEMSRIMMAIKINIFNKGSNKTMIFDEADTGVSGRVAQSMGSKMKQLSINNQVLCITHLAQVASFSDVHYLIKKDVVDNLTKVSISKLNEEDSVKEIAKLISGSKITNESIEQAKKLIQETK